MTRKPMYIALVVALFALGAHAASAQEAKIQKKNPPPMVKAGVQVPAVPLQERALIGVPGPPDAPEVLYLNDSQEAEVLEFIRQSDPEHIEKLLVDIHEQFIHAVKEGRGDRLTDSGDLFSGLIWTGEESVELGLTDGLGSSSYVAREIIEAEEIVEFTAEPDLLERLTDRLGVGVARALSGIMAGSSTIIR